MRAAVEVLQFAGGGTFIVLGLANVVAWRRSGQQRYVQLGLALGIIGAVSIMDRIGAELGYRVQAVTDVTIVMFLLSGYALLQFRDSFVPLSPRTRRLAAWGVIATGLYGIVVRLPAGPHAQYSPAQLLGLAGMLVTWTMCTVEPIVRFARASRGLPAVQRSRLRALAFGYASLVGIILILATLDPAGRHPPVTIAGYLLGIAAAPFIWVSFAPPAWLRRSWRQREEGALMQATAVLTGFSTDGGQLAARGVAWAARLLGADAGFIADASGRPIAGHGLDDATLERMADDVRAGPAPQVVRLQDRTAVVAPFETRDGIGTLAVMSGPWTPLFGTDEVARLGQFAAVVSTALERVELSRAVAAEKARYETLLHTVSDVGEGVVVAEGARLIYANQAYLHITGYSFEEMAAMESLLDLAPDDVRPALLEQFRARRAGEPVPSHYETAFIRKDGARVEVEVALKVLEGDGRTQVISIIRDITERKRADEAIRRSQEQLAEAQQIAHLGSWEWDLRGDVLRWSDEMFRIFHVDPATFVPSYAEYMARIHPDDRAGVQAVIAAALLEGKTYAFDHRIAIGDGDERTLHCKGDAITDDQGEPVRLFGTAQDVTERKHAEDALRQAYEREREAAERLRSVDAMKNAFLTAVSHELRTPLTAVLGFAKTLEHRDDALESEERRLFLGRLSANAVKLDRLLSDLLDVDRLSRGMFEPVRRPVDVGDLLQRVASESALLADRPVELRARSVVVALDAAKVERIIENLIANAVRHTPDGTPIWLRTEPMDDGVLIAVEDAGDGVPKEIREAVFEPFRQGPAIPLHSPGVGIGLSLVFRFASLHGGRAWVEDRPGGGASFRVYLPGAPAAAPDDTRVPTPAVARPR